MSPRRCEKIRAEGSRGIKRIESSRSQGSVGLPSRGHADEVIAVIVPVVVDVQAMRNEAADIDPSATRIDI